MRFSLTLGILFLLSAILQGQDSEVIEYNTEIEVSGGAKLYHISYLVQVNSKHGADFDPIHVPYGNEVRIVSLDVQLEDTLGRVIRKVKRGQMEDHSAFSRSSFYSDRMIRSIPTNNNSYPYRLRFDCRLRYNEFFILCDWDPYLKNELDSRASSLSITVPANYNIAIREEGIGHRKEGAGQERVRYTWESGPLEGYERESFAPHFSEMVPRVMAVPGKFQYGVSGTQNSWSEYGHWEYMLNEGRNVLPMSERQRVDALLEGVEDDREKVRILYHHMQDFTHYIFVAEDVGGQQTYPASYVVENGFGDCKALSNYMQALLRYAGIEAYYTLVYAGSRPRPFFTDFPSNQFNHVIVCAPMKGDTLWLECTDPNGPFGYISDFTQDRPVLLVDNMDSRLVRTPAQKPGMVATIRSFRVGLTSYGDPQVKLVSHLRGDDFEYIRSLDSEVEEKEKDEYLQDFLDVSETRLHSWSIEDAHRDSSSIRLEATFSAGDLVQRMGPVTVVEPPAIRMPEMEDPSERRSPVHVVAPYSSTDSLTLSFPPAWQLMSLPSDTLLQGPLGEYRRSLEMEKGKMVLVRSFELPSGRLPLEDYPAFHEFIEAVDELEEEKILMKNPQ